LTGFVIRLIRLQLNLHSARRS